MGFRAAAAFTVFALVSLSCARAAAGGDQAYAVSGDDTYRIGNGQLPATQITYSGAERLHVDQEGPRRTYRADARYTRTDQSGKSQLRAKFVQELKSSGAFEDREDQDPDFLTVLNQPFAVQLDAMTMRDLRSLAGSVPFRASSPLGGTALDGFLRRAPGGIVNGHQVIGVRFAADGPMNGPLPGHPETSIDGTIRMDGTAYYSIDASLLLALDATLTITGRLQNSSEAVPVKIVYRRHIHADDAAASWRQASDA